MTRHLSSQLGNARHRQNGDDGTLWFVVFRSALSVRSSTLLSMKISTSNPIVTTRRRHRNEYRPTGERNLTQLVRTIPIAHQHTPAVSYLEAF
ncbi:MAG: hypothetical protein ACI915_004933 [Gammaproteobacteria bacterium]|jgi:hypothetical protein